MQQQRAWALAIFLVGTSLASGCKAKPGDACKSQGVCEQGANALVCVDGHYAATSCKGADGCSKQPFRCDFRGNADGDACYEAKDGASYCGAGWKSRVTCESGRVSVEQCGGPHGCYAAGDEAKGCDRDLRVGAPCKKNVGVLASIENWCSNTKNEWLQCKDGKLELLARCRGPIGCSTIDGRVDCDATIGELNDPCVGKFRTCSTNGSLVPSCTDGKLEQATQCPPGKPCLVENGEGSCAK